MITIPITINAGRPCERIALGRRGENEATQIVFDVSWLIDTFGAGTAQLAVIRPEEEDPYPAVVEQDDDARTVTWTLTNADTANAGRGECELFWYVGDTLAKSIVYRTEVMRDIGDVGEDVPEPYETWVEEVLAAGAQAQENADFLRNASATAVTLSAGSNATASVDDGVFTFGIPRGDKGDKGADAVTYVLEPSVNAIVYDPNAEEGARLTPSELTLTTYQIVNGVRSAFGADYIHMSYENADTQASWAAAAGAGAIEKVYTLTHQIPSYTTPGAEIMCDMRKGSTVVARVSIPIVSSGPKGDTGEVSQAEFDALSDDVDDLKSQYDYGCITADLKTALLQLAQKVAYVDENGQDYYDDLYDALYNRYWQVTNTLSHCTTSNESAQTIKGAAYTATITASTGYIMTGATVSITMGGTDITATAYSNGVISIPAVTGALVITISAAAKQVSSISAVYTQSGTVYDTDSLDSLKTDLVVTATYDDSSTEAVTTYTLSGTLADGTSVITVSYGGKTTTFNVIVSARYEYKLSDGSLTKLSGGITNVPDNGGIGLNLSTTQQGRRRIFVTETGSNKLKYTTNNTASSASDFEDSIYYPIRVPADATAVVCAITPSSQYFGITGTVLTDGKYVQTLDDGWMQGSRSLSFEAGTYTHIFITCKYNSSGTSYPTEPTEFTITFS